MLLMQQQELGGGGTFPIDGLLRYFKCDETSGLIAIDSTGTSNGTIGAGVNINVTGKINSGWNFTGTSDAVNIGNVIGGLGAFTVGLWVKANTLSGNQGVYGNFGNKILIRVNNGQTQVYLRTTSGTVNQTFFLTFPDTINYHLLILMYDGSEMTMKLDNLDSILTKAQTGLVYGTASEYLGRYSSIAAGDVDIDEVFIYNRKLTDEECEFFWNNGSGVTY